MEGRFCYKNSLCNYLTSEMATSVLSAAQSGSSCLLLVLLLCCSAGQCGLQKSNPSPPTDVLKSLHNDINKPQTYPEEQNNSLPVFTMDYPWIQVPFEVTLWVLLVSVTKTGMFING